MPVNPLLVADLGAEFAKGYFWTIPTVSYYFRDTANPPATFAYPPEDGVTAFAALPEVTETYVREIFGYFEKIFGLHFVESAGQSGNLDFGSHRMTVGGYAVVPFQGTSLVELNSDFTGPFYNRPGEFVYGALVHELGHAMGLPHPEHGAPSGFLTAMTYEPVLDYATSLGLYDILVLQQRYGAVVDTTSDRYFVTKMERGGTGVFSGDEIRLVGHFCLWDGGGFNAIDLSRNTVSCYLDLRPGEFSVIGRAGALANLVSDQNFSIAFNSRFFQAFGSSAADMIIGNSLGDSLFGGAGSDTISAATATNYLRGDEGNDSIAGGAGFDDINGNMGDDTCVSGGGDDWVVGGKDNDSLTGSAGQNLVYGNLGNDTCDGGAGDDIVRGGQDNDVCLGGAGNDFVSGDRGADTLTGGTGADIFHTFGDAGLDRVADFNRAEGDRVMVDPGTVFTVAQVGADTVISMTGGGQMVLVGVAMGSLTGAWVFGG